MKHEQFFIAESGGGIKATDRDMVYRVRIITAGQGSSAFWPVDVLQRDLELALPVGSQSHMNHPTPSEEWQFPSRRADTVIGKKLTPVEYVASEQSFYADYEFDAKLKTTLEQFFDVLAMSVYLYTEADPGDAHGLPTDIITRIVPHPVNSCDMVAHAGANGAIVSKVSESLGLELRTFAPVEGRPSTKKESEMDEKQLKSALAEALAPVTALVEALTAPPAPASEQATPTQIAETVAESGLSKEGRARVYQRIESGESPATAVEAEKAYTESLRAELKAEMDGAPKPPANPLQMPVINQEGAAGASEQDARRARFESARARIRGQK